MSTITLTAFAWVPDFAKGVVRDLRARWALEEVGLPYEQRLLDFGEQQTSEYRSLQPFGQVPVYQEGDLTLFESGAIVLHVAERSAALLPDDPVGRTRARAWVFAALNSVEPSIQHLAELDLFHADAPWQPSARPAAEAAVLGRLEHLAQWLEGRDYLEERFSAGDLMMTSVLRILRHTDLVARFPALAAYQRRCEARPAFEKALADQLASFSPEPPAGIPA